jgi:hypothetical protein
MRVFSIDLSVRGLLLIKVHINPYIDDPLYGITESVARHLYIPHLELGEREQVGGVGIEPEPGHMCFF